MCAFAVSALAAAPETDAPHWAFWLGPVAFDNALNLEPCASVGRPSLSGQGLSPRNDPFTPAARSVLLASSLVPAGQGEARSAGSVAGAGGG